MKGYFKKLVAGTCLALSVLAAPQRAFAIPLKDFYAQNKKEQMTSIKAAVDAVVAGSTKVLRSTVDKNGQPKTEEKMAIDRKRADDIEKIMENFDPQALAYMIDKFYEKSPDIQLENVIVTYISYELKNKESAAAQQPAQNTPVLAKK
jgi:hypothetical protein